MRRRYWRTRRAWGPRWWIASAISLLISFAALIVLPVWASLPLSFASGLAVSHVQWWLWKRRHPLLPPHELVADLRRAAPWN